MLTLFGSGLPISEELLSQEATHTGGTAILWGEVPDPHLCPAPICDSSAPLLTLAGLASLAMCHVVEDVLHCAAVGEVALAHFPVGLLAPLTLVGMQEKNKLLLNELPLLRISCGGSRPHALGCRGHHARWLNLRGLLLALREIRAGAKLVSIPCIIALTVLTPLAGLGCDAVKAPHVPRQALPPHGCTEVLRLGGFRGCQRRQKKKRPRLQKC